MKTVIDWIKSNLVVTACGFVALLGLVITGYFYVVAAPKYSEAKSEELKVQLQRQNSLRNIPVPVPNADPNAPPDIHSVVINPIVIEEVGNIYRKIQTQYEDILVNAEGKNNRNHASVLLGGTSIWPDKSPTQFFDLYVQAASDYKDHFKAVFDTRNPNSWNMPRMVASNPPTPLELELMLAQSAFDYISSVGAQSASELTQSQADQLYAEQRMKLMQALNQRARSVHLYASLPADQDPFAPIETEKSTATPVVPSGFGGGTTAGTTPDVTEDYPFHIEPWAFSDQPPTPDQLWEGQVQLWIMRDIMITIATVNNVNGTVEAMGPDGSINQEPASVVNSPIKRLLTLHSLPGYVGLHTIGAALGGSSDSEFGSNIGQSLTTASSVPGSSGIPGSNSPSIYPTPPDELAPKEATDRAVEHFGISPTGRVSNSVFDVRHTRLTIDIEAAKLSAFIEALHQTNFMTVIKAEVTDLDEYELLREGYVYGHNDVVRADLIVESLWFRNWTQDLMPKIVKDKLLIAPPGGVSDSGQFE